MIGGGFHGGFPRKLNVPETPSQLGVITGPPTTNPTGSGSPRVLPELVQPGGPRILGKGESVVTVLVEGRGPYVVSPTGHSGPTANVSREAPTLQKGGLRSGIAIIGRFEPWPWKEVPAEAHLADALEASDVRVVRLSQEAYAPSDPSVEGALFTSHPASFGRLDHWKASHTTIVWAPSFVPGWPEHEPVLGAAKKASIFISGDRHHWKELGLDHHLYLPAGCVPEDEFAPNPTVSCAFIGTIYNDRRRRIAQLVKKFGGVLLDRMPLWRYGRDLSRFVQTVKVVVGDNARNDIPGFWSSRNYVVPGAGGFLLAPAVPGLEQHFALDREIAVYNSMDELESKLHQWISDDDGREAARLAGHQRVRRDHTWQARVKSLVAVEQRGDA